MMKLLREDWTPEFFKLMQEMGEDIDVMGIINEQEPAVYPHDQVDGISLLIDLLNKNNIKVLEYPKLPVRPKPSFFARYLQYLKWSMSMPYKTKQWINTEVVVTDKSYRTIKLDFSETEQAKEKAAAHGVSLNSWLLFHLNKAVSLYYAQDSTRKAYWMIPIATYEEVHADIEIKNRVSFIDAEIEDHHMALDIHRQLKQKINDKMYWGTRLATSLGKLLGKRLYRPLIHFGNKYLLRNGTFTNLGSWVIADEDAQKIQSLHLIAPVGIMNPTSASAVELNGKLNLGFMAHSSLNMNTDMLEGILKAWKKSSL
jgi:hypothetical protein